VNDINHPELGLAARFRQYGPFGENVLEEIRVQHLRTILNRFVVPVDIGSTDKTLVRWLAALADKEIRDALRSDPDAAARFDRLLQADVTVIGSLAMAPMGISGNASASVPLPADTIQTDEISLDGVTYVAAVLLAVIAWLVTFAGPVMISKMPQADQSTMNDYYSGIPGLALVLTGYIITHRPKGCQ
jgi:hypothetical protein